MNTWRTRRERRLARRTEVEMGTVSEAPRTAERTAIVVPGHGRRGRDGVYRISATCLGLVREADRISGVAPIEAVVFSGWSPIGGTTEAEQMREAWQGGEVELVVEP